MGPPRPRLGDRRVRRDACRLACSLLLAPILTAAGAPGGAKGADGPGGAKRATSSAPPTLVTGKGDRLRPVRPTPPPAARAPDDPLFRFQWNLHAMQLPGAWAVSRGAGVIVAVLDTGVAYEDRGRYRRASDLAADRIARGYDFVAHDAHPDDVPPADGRRTHGTQMAEIIAAGAGNRIGAAGVAPAARIMPIRVLRPDLGGSARTIALGLRYAADHGAKVANLSIAGPTPSSVLGKAIDYAYARGVTIVAAAGNDGQGSVSFPAAYPKVISVGAVDQGLRRAAYSDYGTALDLVAPAGAGADLDTGYGPADGVIGQTLKGGPSSFCFCFTASTSAAAAEVSGVAALLIASGRARTPAAVRRALLDGARDLGAPGWDAEYGAGVVQAWGALQAARGPSRRRASRPSANASSGFPTAPLVGAGIAVAASAGVVLITRRRART